MAEIAAACEEFGFEVTDDGISHNDVKLGEVGCTDGKWWISQHQLLCDSTTYYEELLDRPFHELTTKEWQQLREYNPLPKIFFTV